MGFIPGLVNVDLGNIGKALSGAGDLAVKLRSAITGEPDPIKKAEMEATLIELESKLSLGQQAINQVEAKHSSIFIAGWRPFIGWICGLGIGINFIAFPLARMVLVVMKNPTQLPPLDIGELITILIAMLGMGGMRSWEKKNGVNGKH